MNKFTIKKDATFGDEIYRGPMGAAKIVKGSKFNSYKWRIYFFEVGALKADEHADLKTRKAGREFATQYVVYGYI